MDTDNKRDIWVDNVKVVACILVVLGHFFKSMVQAELMDDTFAYRWFEDTIYYFHVPLFFICSGYLYQKYSRVNNLTALTNNIKKKFLVLGVPYFVFSLATWVLKKIFSSQVNRQIGGLVDTLFVHPTSPYWYLYILFVFFLFTFTTKNKKSQLSMLAVALVLKMLSIWGFGIGLYIVDKTIEQWIWFVLGMCFSYEIIKFPRIYIGTILFVTFLCGSFWVSYELIDMSILGFVLGLIACYGVITIIYNLFSNGIQRKWWGLFAKYTMPIFLMHTLFAAPFRSVLLKIGISNIYVHSIGGVIVSIAGPMVAMIVLEKLKPLDFVVYPHRYIRFK